MTRSTGDDPTSWDANRRRLWAGVVSDAVVAIGLFVGFDVNGDDDGRGEVVKQFVLDSVGDVVALSNSQVGIDRD